MSSRARFRAVMSSAGSTVVHSSKVTPDATVAVKAKFVVAVTDEFVYPEAPPLMRRTSPSLLPDVQRIQPWMSPSSSAPKLANAVQTTVVVEPDEVVVRVMWPTVSSPRRLIRTA